MSQYAYGIEIVATCMSQWQWFGIVIIVRGPLDAPRFDSLERILRAVNGCKNVWECNQIFPEFELSQ